MILSQTNLGISLSSNSCFKIGETVLEESPVWTSVMDPEACFPFLDLFKCFEPTLNEPSLNSLLDKFNSCIKINSHFIDNEAKLYGLFPIASKADHSCSPNCNTVYQSPGKISFVAIKEIVKGEFITINYLASHELYYSTRKRRQILLARNSFHCNCTRCLAIDEMRMLPCSFCSGYIRFHNDSWTCIICSSKYDPSLTLLKIELEIEDHVVDHDTGKIDLTDKLLMLLDLSKPLGKLHWSVISLKRILLEITKEEDILKRNDLVIWMYNHLFPINPVAASCEAFYHLENVDLYNEQVLIALRGMFMYFRLKYGAEDDDVKDWSNRVML